MSLDMTSFDAALKSYYTNDEVENLVYKNRPFFALIPKMEQFFGKDLPIPLIYGNPQGRSAGFARAQARGAVTNSYLKAFKITRVKDYSIATIDNETLEASKNDKGAFLEAATTEIDGAINSLSNSIAVDMYRSGYGDRGIVGTSGVSGATITLSEKNDIVNFEVGMELVVSSSQASNTLRALGSSGNGLIVTAVDRTLGKLTFGFNVTDATNGIPGTTDADVLFVRGDREDSATPARLKLAGLEAWIPQTAPSSTAFFGVDRTADLVRLSGVRYDAAGVPIEEALIEGATQVAREGGEIDTYFMNYSNYSNLEKSLGSKVQYVDMAANATIAFRGIRVNGPMGEIKIVPDRNCPVNRAFGLKLDTWKLYSLGKAVRVIDTDGLKMLRQSTADGVEVRYGGYLQMGCRAPGWNVNIKLA